AKVAVRTADAPGPARERGAAARDVDQAAERVAAEERTLRSAHELNLIDVNQLDARRVGVQLRHAIDVGRHARVVRAGADTAEARVAQLARGELAEEDVGRELAGLADAPDAGVLQRLAGDGGHTDRCSLNIFRLLLRGDRNGGQPKPQGAVFLSHLPRGAGRGLLSALGPGRGRHDEYAANDEYPESVARRNHASHNRVSTWVVLYP